MPQGSFVGGPYSSGDEIRWPRQCLTDQAAGAMESRKSQKSIPFLSGRDTT